MDPSPNGSGGAASPSQPAWAALVERWAPAILLPLMVLDAAAQACAKPLWFDELITYSLARLPNLGLLWNALLTAADAQPPLAHLSMRASHFLFGEGELASRLPNLAGFVLMSAALYLAIRRRQGGLYAICGVLFAWTTMGYEYAYEARPYGLMLGFGACAYLGWQLCTEDGRPRWAIAALAMALALALSSHYYAALILAPLSIGELVRTRMRGRLDWPVWGAFAAGSLAFAAHLPFIVAIRNQFQSGYWRGVGWNDILVFYFSLLQASVVPVAVMAVICGVVKARTAAKAKAPADLIGGLPRHEAIAAVCWGALPVVYVAASIFGTGGFTNRYALVSLVGVALVFVMVLYDALQSNRAAVAAGALALVAGFLAIRIVPTVEVYSGTTPLEALRDVELANLERSIPADGDAIAVASPLKYSQYAHYSSEQLKRRLVYPIDTAAARAHTPGDNCDVTLRELSRWIPLATPAFADFRHSHASFYVAAWKPAPFDWLSKALRHEGAQLDPVAADGDIEVFHCCGPRAAPLQTSKLR